MTREVTVRSVEETWALAKELAAKLKQQVPRLNIIYLTCHTEYTRQALDSYCSGYILKPLTPEKIRHEIDHLRFPVRGLKA